MTEFAFKDQKEFEEQKKIFQQRIKEANEKEIKMADVFEAIAEAIGHALGLIIGTIMYAAIFAMPIAIVYIALHLAGIV